MPLSEILLNFGALVLAAGTLVSLCIAADRWLGRIEEVRTQLLLRSLLYAVNFTPTAYHHAPNTIVAPFHLSTLGGQLFYGYPYTLGMFLTGIAIPIVCGWAAISLFLMFRQKLPSSKQDAGLSLQ